MGRPTLRYQAERYYSFVDKLTNIALRIVPFIAIAIVAIIVFYVVTRPPLLYGVIVEKNFEPAHTYTTYNQVYAGEYCTISGKTESCTSRYISVPQTNYVPDRWTVKVSGNCKLNDKGREECQTEWKPVSFDFYRLAKIGDTYDARPPSPTPGYR